MTLLLSYIAATLQQIVTSFEVLKRQVINQTSMLQDIK